VARTIIAPEQLPVGVVTLSAGGAYLVWLLASFGRKAR
jgi:iron complex transport system permease protein